MRSTWGRQGHAWAAIVVAVRDITDRGEGVALLGVLRLGRTPLIPEGAARGVFCALGPSTFKSLGSHDSGVAGVSHRGPAHRLWRRSLQQGILGMQCCHDIRMQGSRACVISSQVARGRLVSINCRNDTQRHNKGTYKSLVSSMCSLRRSMRASRPPAGVMPLARH